MADVKRKISSLDKRKTASEDSDYLVIDNGSETSIILMENLLKDFAHTEMVESEINKLDESKVDKVEGSSLMTTEEHNKLTNIEENAEVNKVEDIQVDSVSIVKNKIANLDSSSFGKVDDVKVDDVSVVKDKIAYITSYDDTSVKSRIKAIEDDYLKSSDKTELVGEISAEETRAKSVENSIKEDVAKCSLITETGNKVDLELDSKTYELTAKLYDKNNNLISTSTTIDLPIESLILNVEYDKDKKAIIITLKDGTTKEVPIGDLISGLVNETTFKAEVDRATKAETALGTRISTIEDKESTWDGKQDAISDLAAIRSGASAGATAVQDVKVNGTSVVTNKVASVSVPTKTSEITNDSDYVSDKAYIHTDNNYTTDEKNKLGGIEVGAEVNVQADWTETDTTKDSYIKNKPSLYKKKTIFSDGNAIYEDSAMTKTLTFAQVKAILDDNNNDVEMWNGNYILLPEYSATQSGVTAIWFNGTTSLSGKTYLYRITINSDDQVINDEYQLLNTSDVDSALSDVSTNPVQNKVLKAELDKKLEAEDEELGTTLTINADTLQGYNAAHFDDAIDNKVDKVTGKSLISDTEIERLSKVDNYDDTAIRQDVAKCSLITETGNKIDLELNTKTYELTAKLYDKNDNLISTSTTIDLPLETLVLNVEYDSTKKAIIITLKDGTTKEVPVGDLVSGLVSETTFNAEVERATKAESDLDTNKVDKEDGYSLMSEAEHTKLDGIEEGANKYVLPSDVVQDSDYVHTDNNFTDDLKTQIGTNATAISEEASARESADATLRSNTDAEVTRAKGVESDLDSRITKLEDYRVYGFRRYRTSSDPAARIEYTDDAKDFTPFTYDFTNYVENEGSWSDFIEEVCRPVMLYKDGTVAYELDRDDTTKTSVGTDSDISNTSFDGNAMVEFRKFKWVQRYTIGDYDYVAFANYKKNDTFKDYSFIGEDGNLKDVFYFSMFEGYNDGTCLRSIADTEIYRSTGGAVNEIAKAVANGDGWNIGAWSQLNYIWDLLTLIGKSDNLQATFGQGISTYAWNSGTNPYGWTVGATKDKGAWYGDSAGQTPVRTLYIEDLWGRAWDRYNGLVNDNGTIKVKMTPPYPTPTESSSTYSEYVSVGTTPSEGYVKTADCNEYGFIPTATGGSATTYYCDYFYKNDSGVKFLLVGGSWPNGGLCGRYCSVYYAFSNSYVNIGSRLLKI